jgi:Response regulator containing CheY-like receiver, AAA-type ATPase, and DNA-binding domains
MKLGAFFYLTKPFDIDELNIQVEKALEVERLKNEVDYLRLERDKDILILNNSPMMKSVYNTVQQVAGVSATVLITGESGTGKEVIANQIHRLSARKESPFIAVNCGAINENLLESELFGHEKGAFTGAIGRKLGKFELADKGTIFLDEIGEMSMSMQVKLLRVLQEREITRVGGETNIKIDVRIISATNKNLMDEIKKGNFREDLYYRINVVPVELPPLRERREDIESYVKFFINKFSQGKKIVISDEAMNLLKEYSFPGNIRELENIIERMVLLSPSDELQVSSLPKEVYRENKKEDSIIYFPSEGIDLENVEKSLIVKSLQLSNYNQSKAAKLLNITRSALIYRMQKYEILGGKDEKEKD